jgi:hypothetical protein
MIFMEQRAFNCTATYERYLIVLQLITEMSIYIYTKAYGVASLSYQRYIQIIIYHATFLLFQTSIYHATFLLFQTSIYFILA